MLKHPRSHVKYLGAFAAASWEYRQAPDTQPQMRQAIVFHLVPSATDVPAQQPPSLDGPDLAELRMAAVSSGSEVPSRETHQAFVTYIQRSAIIRDYALARAAGNCERCAQAAPFRTATGAPFLEVHHIHRLTDGGPDLPDAVIALCPNCHREAHHGQESEALKALLISIITAKE